MDFTRTELFGGALMVDLPARWIDSSILRQIPDHQEVYLSPTGSTTIVVEINERVSSGTAANNGSRLLAQAGSSEADSAEKRDKDALLYHLKDLVESTPERSQPSTLTESNHTTIHLQPTPVSLPRIDGHPPAYILSALSKDTITDSRSDQAPQIKETTVSVLMVRLEKQATDLLVILNVPLKGEGDPAEDVQEDEGWAKEVMERIAATLAIQNWSLFGEDET